MAKRSAQSKIEAPAIASWTTQRLMDPIHGLIAFEDNPLDRIAWALINTPEFQRLRRIKQLGFSEYVFPGATHSRFSHSIGVFHNARKLAQLLKRQGFENQDRSVEACIAALLHDLGHGPFSHTFERVQKKIGRSKRHEDWTSDLISSSDGMVSKVIGSDASKNVAKQLRKKDPSDIYDSIVASQFDADRLDYLVRDRYMTGVGLGQFDEGWLLSSIRIGKIALRHDADDEIVTVPGLYISEKGLRAAEGYLLARFHMYDQVYLHKATRCMEAMLEEFLSALSQGLKNGETKIVDPKSPLGLLLTNDEVDSTIYSKLDDVVLWAEIGRIGELGVPALSELARRILHRNLYKCVDVGRRSNVVDQEHVVMRFRKELQDYQVANHDIKLLQDRPRLSPYTLHGYDEAGALQKVLVGSDGGAHDQPPDIATRSQMINSLRPITLFRVYVENADIQTQIREILEKVANVGS